MRDFQGGVQGGWKGHRGQWESVRGRPWNGRERERERLRLRDEGGGWRLDRHGIRSGIGDGIRVALAVALAHEATPRHARRHGSCRLRRVLVPTLLALLPLGACDDSPVEPQETPAAEVGVVVNSVDRSLTVFPVDSPQAAFTIGLAPDGSPVTLAARGAYVVVPLGTVPAAAVVDLRERAVIHTVALPEGSSATGAAFINDSIALVANPGRNSVTPINVLRGTAGAEIAVGRYPQAIIAVGDTAYILNAELGPDFSPDGPGTITVLAGAPLAVLRTITLSGTNPGSAAADADGRLYVIDSGSFGAADGSLSVIDRGTLTETAHVTGFGDFPSGAALDDSGRLFVASFAYGIVVWETHAGTFSRGPDAAVTPGGIASTSGLAVDSQGRLYAAKPECTEPSSVFRLTGTFEVAEEIPAGTCPFGIVFTTIPAPEA
ncbi:MAG TPA: hypothetical protein VF188_17055 [Longimicrobiales bacterium]